MNRRLVSIILVLILVASSLSLLQSKRVEALSFGSPFTSGSIFGRQFGTEYFSGNSFDDVGVFCQNFWTWRHQTGVASYSDGFNYKIPVTVSYTSNDYAAAFKTLVNNDLNVRAPTPTPSGCTTAGTPEYNNAVNNTNIVGTALIVDTMLGTDGTLFDGPLVVKAGKVVRGGGVFGGVRYAQEHYSDWASKVDQYQAAGRIDWNWAHDYSGTLRADSIGVRNGIDAGFYGNGPNPNCSWVDPNDHSKGFGQLWVNPNNHSLGRKPDPNCGLDLSQNYIQFQNPDGSFFTINKKCGNTTGVVQAITDLAYDLYPSVGLSSSSPALDGGTGVVPGVTYILAGSINNTGPATSATSALEISTGAAPPAYNSAILSPSSPLTSVANSPNIGQDDLNQYAMAIYGFNNAAGMGPAVGTQHWYWWSNQIPHRGIGTASFRFSIKPDAIDGTPICFSPDVSAKDGLSRGTPSGYRSGTPYCVEVHNPRNPYLTTTKGDVQAGGAVLGTVNCSSSAGATGSIIHGTLSNSKSQYVVSAGGSISQFGSDNNAGSRVLALGNTSGTGGAYGSVCRPDLVKAAQAFMRQNSSAVVAHVGSTSLDIGDINAVGNNHMSYVKGNLTINAGGGSSINERTTVYVEGDVYIKTNIAHNTSTAYLPSALPSFGLITTGTIYVDAAVGNLDGYYFANAGQIVTCSKTSPNWQAVTAANSGSANNYINACNRLLTVNGLLMANDFVFNRTGNGSASSGPIKSEEVNFLGQIFIASPPAFSDVVSPSVTTPSYAGERPPLY